MLLLLKRHILGIIFIYSLILIWVSNTQAAPVIPIQKSYNTQKSAFSSVLTETNTLTTTNSVYTVQAGDILLRIAAKYQVTVEAIMTANNITNPRLLQIGQQLLIPLKSEVYDIEHEELETDITSKQKIEPIPYSIKAGDTLLALAIKYNLDIAEIMALNPTIQPTRLQIGQIILMPQATTNRVEPDVDLNDGEDTSNPSETSTVTLPELEVEVLNLVNAERAKQGLAPYKADELLSNIARNHAQDMVNRNYFSHVTPEGKTLRNRLADYNLPTHWVGENIQRNTKALNQTSAYAINWFMNSRPHRNNILHQQYTNLGVGLVEGPPGWYTFVLVFAKR